MVMVRRRLELAEDMLVLVIKDGEGLPEPLPEEPYRLYEAVGSGRRQARRLPLGHGRRRTCSGRHATCRDTRTEGTGHHEGSPWCCHR